MQTFRTVQGNPIIKHNNNESEILLFIVWLSPLACAAEIAGTNAVVNATFNESGNVASISAFALNIPYLTFAASSPKIGFNILTTVNESTNFITDVKIAVKEIGIESHNIIFTILFTEYFFSQQCNIYIGRQN